MNDPQFIEAARKLAVDAIQASNDPSARLDYISMRLIARPLTPIEREKILTAEKNISARYKVHPKDAQNLLTIGQLAPDKNIPAAEQATWTMMASTMLNLDETLSR